MRTLLVLCLVSGCGDDRGVGPKDAPPTQDDAADAEVSIYPACASPKAGTTIGFREIGTVNNVPVLATSPKNDGTRLFVLEQPGVIRLFKNEVLQPAPFLDLSQTGGGPVIGPPVIGDEKGMLGMAFHPDYEANGTFFLFYTLSRLGAFHDIVVRCQRSASDPDKAEPTCADVLIFRDPYSNHNGGMMEFGRDGYLYIGTGDGGGGGDPFGNAQERTQLLGKMLRIDVDNKLPGQEYGIPADNPFAAGGGAPEVFMIGLRNPWRWSFDVATGDMWIGDVGQQMVEEMNVLRPAQQKGANLGWSLYEGTMCCVTTPYRCESAAPYSSCDPRGMFFPQDSRFPTGGDTGWRSIIAGTVYRGNCFPDLRGWHYYTDWNMADLVKARLKPNDMLEIVDLPVKLPGNPTSFHHDGRGEIYLTNMQGKVFRMEAQ